LSGATSNWVTSPEPCAAEKCEGEQVSLTADNQDAGATYAWDFGDGSSVQSGVDMYTAQYTYPTAGTYIITLTITTANGCITTQTNTILVNPLPSVTLTNDGPICLGTNTATLTATPTGGTPTYTYAWAHDVNETGAALTNINAGTYVVTVTDTKGCTATATSTVTTHTAVPAGFQIN